MTPTRKSRSRKRSGNRAPPAPKNQGTKRKMAETATQAASNGRYFEIKTMQDILKDGFTGTVDRQAAVFLTGVMQYIATEIIEVSGNAAKESTPPDEPFSITPKDILKGLESDKELKEIFIGESKSLARKVKEKQ